MKPIGFFLLIAGFLVGAYSTALDIEATNWSYFIPAAIAAIVGVILIKREESGQATSEHVLAANRAELTESLSNIVGNIDQMISAGSSVSTDKIRDEIDSRLRADLRRFADARESMIHLFSLQAYADIMSNFATGERYVNRVWSASADGYDYEARSYLEKARSQFSAASQQLEALAS
jgi:hypothetical protein